MANSILEHHFIPVSLFTIIVIFEKNTKPWSMNDGLTCCDSEGK